MRALCCNLVLKTFPFLPYSIPSIEKGRAGFWIGHWILDKKVDLSFEGQCNPQKVHHPTSHSHRTHSHCSQFGKYSTTSLKNHPKSYGFWMIFKKKLSKILQKVNFHSFYSHCTNSHCSNMSDLQKIFRLILLKLTCCHIHIWPNKFELLYTLDIYDIPSAPLNLTLKKIVEKCIKLNLCWWREKMIPDNCSKLCRDITKHSDISRISQMNCSKSFKQFASDFFWLFHNLSLQY